MNEWPEPEETNPEDILLPHFPRIASGELSLESATEKVQERDKTARERYNEALRRQQEESKFEWPEPKEQEGQSPERQEAYHNISEINPDIVSESGLMEAAYPIRIGEHGVSGDSEPLTDFLDRYIPDWENLDSSQIGDELDRLGEDFQFAIEWRDYPGSPNYHRLRDQPPGYEGTDSVIDSLIVRYFPPGTAAYEEPKEQDISMGGYARPSQELDEMGYPRSKRASIIEPLGSGNPVEEPMADFLTRYVPNWREMNPVERRVELDNLAKTITFDYDVMGHEDHDDWEPVEIYNGTDELLNELLRSGKDWWVDAGLNEEFSYVYYYPAGTAAFADKTIGPHPETGNQTDAFEPGSYWYSPSDKLYDALASHEESMEYDLNDVIDNGWLRIRYTNTIRNGPEVDIQTRLKYRQRAINFLINYAPKDAKIILDYDEAPYEQYRNLEDLASAATFAVPVVSNTQVTFDSMTVSETAVDILLDTVKKWEAQANVIIADSRNAPRRALRAQFAADTAFIAAKTLMNDKGHVIAAHTDTEIVGLAVYRTYPDHTALIDLVTVAPKYQPGNATATIRGIGSGLVCAIAAKLIEEGVTKVCLKPLDEDAETFWRNRGFITSGSHKLCIIDDIAILFNSCANDKDCPDTGDNCAVGNEEQVAEYRKPSVARELASYG